MNIIVGNILSFLGGTLDFLFSLKFNDKLKIIQGNFISSSLSVVAYMCLGAYDGVIGCIVTLLRLGTIYYKDKYHKKCHVFFGVFLALYALVFIDYSGVQTIILFLSTMCSFIPKWICKDMQKIRIGGLCANVLMIFYNLMISNYAVIPVQALGITLTTITLIRWAVAKKRAKKKRRNKTTRRGKKH